MPIERRRWLINLAVPSASPAHPDSASHLLATASGCGPTISLSQRKSTLGQPALCAIGLNALGLSKHAAWSRWKHWIAVSTARVRPRAVVQSEWTLVPRLPQAGCPVLYLSQGGTRESALNTLGAIPFQLLLDRTPEVLRQSPLHGAEVSQTGREGAPVASVHAPWSKRRRHPGPDSEPVHEVERDTLLARELDFIRIAIQTDDHHSAAVPLMHTDQSSSLVQL